MLRHVAQCCGKKSMIAAQRELLWHETQCHGTKNITADNMRCHGMKNMAAAPTPNKRTARLIFFICVFGYFSPKPFWFAVEGFRVSWFTGDRDTFSTSACQRRKYFAKPLLLGFYLV